ncbi:MULTISPECIES: hypothetical protein [unclassified Mesorhizobium]|uniref:hypothetical protein n=1 Tax=unclassified Mesorhizobium TaxID=325217 RepID=UPI000FCA32B8|nr:MULTISPECIES: hypothetical protein [unclassified Mesorhizobium]RVD54537.1 hypothetical protein EN783_30365 [Mesorhizobium sp. M2D.F.Ca.ET.140.01.1.1]TGP69390.1 hypothetical protein EN867_30945 [Mesorhizobium sp. M2D.F.Ca.ET.224.01.1.1]TGP86610.1 hypothetical protein EN865_30940 [bacterium M00.F.Ca.ET.222.01.1.1]
MQAQSAAIAKPSPTVRSRVTNGSALFAEGGDERGPWSRRFRDLVIEHTSDAGGVAVLSEAQRSIIRRASTLEVQLEQLEARFSEGPADASDLNMYSTLSNTLRRLLADIGLERKRRDITPSLQDIIAGRAA